MSRIFLFVENYRDDDDDDDHHGCVRSTRDHRRKSKLECGEYKNKWEWWLTSPRIFA